MKRKRLTEGDIIALLKNKGAKFPPESPKTVQIDPKSGKFGNGSWGRLDYLRKQCGYTVTDFTGKPIAC